MKLTIIVFICIYSFNIFASVQKVMTITNDVDTNIVSISIEDNDDKFLKVHKIEKTRDGELVNSISFDLNELYKAPAVQIKSKREIIKIRFNRSFDPYYGGSFVLDYLVSGISGERRNLVLDLGRNGNKWEITLDNKPADKLHVIGNRKPLVGVIGISSIKVK